MRKIFRNTVIILALLLPPLCLEAAGGSAGSDFLCWLQDARPEALAGAFIATATGVEAALTNPAGLSSLTRKQFSISHYIGLFDQTTENFAFAMPFSSATIAFTGSYNYTSNFVEVDEFGDKKFPVPNYDYMVSFSVGKILEKWLTAGITAKYFGSFLYAYTRTGWAFDMGLQGKFGLFRAGILCQNFGRQSAFIKKIDSTPFLIKIGAGISTAENSADPINAEACYNIPLTNEERYLSAGFEYIKGNMIAFRAGVRINELSPVSLYAGIGIKFADYTLNYALGSFQNSGNSHKISLILTF